MYVDETGSPEFSDHTKFFILGGIIIHENDIWNIRKRVFNFKQEHFTGTYIESEIHMHDMLMSKKGFKTLRGEEKRYVVEKAYEMIKDLPITVITAAINKTRFRQEHPKWSVLKTALIILVSKYNYYLESVQGYRDQGIIKFDKSSDKRLMEIINIMKMLRKDKKNNQINNILGEPDFVNSDGSAGIQISDVASFCIGKQLQGKPMHSIFWDIVKEKTFSNGRDEILGYGLNVFPHMTKEERKDIQP